MGRANTAWSISVKLLEGSSSQGTSGGVVDLCCAFIYGWMHIFFLSKCRFCHGSARARRVEGAALCLLLNLKSPRQGCLDGMLVGDQETARENTRKHTAL